MKRRSTVKCAATTALLAALFTSTLSAQSQISARKEILPTSHPLAKIVVQIAQVGARPSVAANGIVVGGDGCHILTNFHVAFVKDRDSQGKDVYVDSIAPGHVVEVGVDLNPNSGGFDRTIKARVVEYANYNHLNPKDRRRIRNDLAMLKLDDCLGKNYGIARFEQPDESVNVPQTELSTLSISKLNAKKSALFYQATCKSGSDTNVAGVFFQDCEIEPGMSGSPIFRKDADGGYTIVGISTGHLVIPGQPDVPYAIYSSALAPFVQSVIGNGSIQMGPPSNPSAKRGSPR
jgi:Trypsin-like peptidase domain